MIAANEVARGNKRDRTRAALIESAIELFGTRGFAAASIRDIAAGAGANIASIGYHFGGKEGLRVACARHAADFIRSVAAKGFSAAERTEKLTPAAARRILCEFVSVVVRGMMTAPGAAKIVRFLLREIVTPSDALQIIYTTVIEPTHRRLCGLWGTATGEDPESAAVRLAVFAIMGQAVYFRIGQAIIVRRMGWQAYGRDEAEAIAAEIVANLNSALDRHAALAGKAAEPGSKRT